MKLCCITALIFFRVLSAASAEPLNDIFFSRSTVSVLNQTPSKKFSGSLTPSSMSFGKELGLDDAKGASLKINYALGKTTSLYISASYYKTLSHEPWPNLPSEGGNLWHEDDFTVPQTASAVQDNGTISSSGGAENFGNSGAYGSEELPPVPAGTTFANDAGGSSVNGGSVSDYTYQDSSAVYPEDANSVATAVTDIPADSAILPGISTQTETPVQEDVQSAEEEPVPFVPDIPLPSQGQITMPDIAPLPPPPPPAPSAPPMSDGPPQPVAPSGPPVQDHKSTGRYGNTAGTHAYIKSEKTGQDEQYYNEDYKVPYEIYNVMTGIKQDIYKNDIVRFYANLGVGAFRFDPDSPFFEVENCFAAEAGIGISVWDNFILIEASEMLYYTDLRTDEKEWQESYRANLFVDVFKLFR